MLAITNAILVLHDHYIPDGILLIENGKIAAFGEQRNLPVPEGCEVLDAEGMFVGPGFIDIHTHANDRVFFWEDPRAVAKYHLKQGTTTVLAATYMALGKQEMLNAIGVLRAAMTDPECPNLAGI